MGIGIVLFWGLLIFGAFVLLRYAGLGTTHHSATPATAEQILAERFARGEIDAQEYQQRLDTLRGLTPTDTIPPSR